MSTHRFLRVVALYISTRAVFAQDVQALEARFRKLEESMRILQEEMKSVQAELTAARQSQQARPAAPPATQPRPQTASPAEPLGPGAPLPVTYIGTETRTRQTVEDY